MLLPVHEAARRRAGLIDCAANLKQINLAFRIWEQDNGGAHGYRTALLQTNNQTMGLNSGQIAWVNMMGFSNIVSEARILQCPADHETTATTNSAGMKIRISYFLNLDAATKIFPQKIMSGDDNFAVSGVQASPRILDLTSSAPISWVHGRHGPVNNISFADGSVAGASASGLQNAIRYSFGGTGSATNRVAIP